MVVAATKLLTDKGARSFVVITPTDIKVFEVSGENSGSNGSVPSVGDDETQVTDPETLKAIAQEEAKELPGEPTVEDVTNGKVRRRKKYESAAGHEEDCTRCKGQGRISVLLDGGQPSEAGCPICQGTGKMKRYGVRR
jgi:DnaJ-class molecular chaperone